MQMARQSTMKSECPSPSPQKKKREDFFMFFVIPRCHSLIQVKVYEVLVTESYIRCYYIRSTKRNMSNDAKGKS
jgi:hypothetical protein